MVLFLCVETGMSALFVIAVHAIHFHGKIKNIGSGSKMNLARFFQE